MSVESRPPAPLLEIEDLVVGYGDRHTPPVLDGVGLDVSPGEIVGLIGETGSGKTTLARAAVGLVPARSGRVGFDGTDLTALGWRALREFRRRGQVQYVFQDPLRALDPDLTAAESVAEPLAVAGSVDRAERAERVARALRAVGLEPAHGERVPGGLSGGQRQRVLLARALVTEPRLLICDEPVSALDAANRNHVLRLLLNLRDESGIAALVITHDLHSLSGVADRVAVLHDGRLVEQGRVREVLDAPQHPYTRRLLAAAPRLHTLGAPPAPA
ncbi:ABC transporter ATP-binding protein, partial [Actinospica durhamensis]|uniref:ABC transporter ATP-binding protein n=1 Tax=Actinospica durhamensis TaxID=1508375 RepID=UPI0027DB6EF2